MTDTTDIAALRDAAALIAHGYKQRWGFETNDDTGFVDVGTLDHDGNLCPFIEVSISNWSDEDGDDERLAEFLTLANPVAILALLDQIEAERQRADNLVLHVNSQANMREKAEEKYTEVSGWYVKMKTRMLKAEEELAALKTDIESYIIINGELATEVEELKGSIGAVKDWEIDHSTDVPILIYKKCSVIESEQAYGLLNLIKKSELKGDQVPVRYMAEWSSQYGGMEYDYSEVRSEMDEVAAEHDGSVIELFTSPQKPVVKLAGDMPRAPFNYGMYAKGWNDRGLADKLGIEAAGGVVKDGE